MNSTIYYSHIYKVKEYLFNKYGIDFNIPCIDYEKSYSSVSNDIYFYIYRMKSGNYEIVDYVFKSFKGKTCKQL